MTYLITTLIGALLIMASIAGYFLYTIIPYNRRVAALGEMPKDCSALVKRENNV